MAYLSCGDQCNPQLNPNRHCSQGCFVFCPSICRIIDSSPPPSSSLPPANSPYASPTTAQNHHSPHSLPLRISLFFLVATFSLFFLYTLCKFCTEWYRSRCRRTPPPPSPEIYEIHDNDVVDHPIWYIRTVGLQLAEISAITVVKFSKGDGVVEGSDCSVCLNEFGDDESLRLLPNCKHAFHITCIDTWLRSHTNCPICRAGIVNMTAAAPSPEQNSNDVGIMEETNLGISIHGGEASGSSSLRMGETDEEEAKAEGVNSGQISSF